LPGASAVAEGAGMLADKEEINILDIAPASLQVSAWHGRSLRSFPIIKRNSQLGAAKTAELWTTTKNQGMVEFELLEGEVR